MKHPFFCKTLLSCAAALAFSCSTTPKEDPTLRDRPRFDSPMEAPAASKASEPKKLWAKRLNGYISDLNLSQDGKWILAATLPNYDRPGGSTKNLLRYFDERGKELWSRVMPTQVKSQAISRNGSLAVATTHDDQILAFARSGKLLWKASGTCTPIILDAAKKILCYHDDDAEPRIAFDVFDGSGKKIHAQPISEDILTLKVSEDERYIAIALTGGQVIVFDSDFKASEPLKVQGEIVDVDISSGPEPKVAVLSSLKPGVQKLTLFSGGKLISETSPSAHLDQIEFVPDASAIAAFGNGHSGQFLTWYAPIAHGMTEVWKKGAVRNAHYTPTMYTFSPSQMILGFENVVETSRQSFVLSLDAAGSSLWRLPVVQSLGATEGAYLYGLGVSQEGRRVVFSTDDGSFGLFQLSGN